MDSTVSQSTLLSLAVVKAVGHGHCIVMLEIRLTIVLIGYRGKDDVIPAQVYRIEASVTVIISSCSFSPGRMPTSTCGRLGAMAVAIVFDAVGRNLRNEDFTAQMMADGIHHQCHTGFERDVEAGHAHIGNGELGSSAVALIDKEGNHGTAGAITLP